MRLKAIRSNPGGFFLVFRNRIPRKSSFMFISCLAKKPSLTGRAGNHPKCFRVAAHTLIYFFPPIVRKNTQCGQLVKKAV